MKQNILIATDLDRTLIANGPQPESPRARPLFDRIVARPEVHLAYVTGRDLQLVREAMKTFSLPKPDYIVSDVGTSIWCWQGSDWQRISEWDVLIAPGWMGFDGPALADWLRGVRGIEIQEPVRQGRFKLSYYRDDTVAPRQIVGEITAILQARGLHVQVIYSEDETTGDRFLDVLPGKAGKLGAVRFLMEWGRFASERVMFSGDSGNDLDVLGSPIQSVLVANAIDQVRQDAVALSRDNGCPSALYLARGKYGMNGCYAAGILEGLANFIPDAELLAMIEEKGGR
ncbi:MAG: HAD-IIB family hydrolase [Magnetococcales bacterium]|nr:HAD-IIB family hydrolase [Magnetococcales bacterium]